MQAMALAERTARPAATGACRPPAGQRCFAAHHRRPQQCRKQAAARCQQDQAPAAEQQLAGGRRRLLAAGLLAAAAPAALAWPRPAAAEEEEASSSGSGGDGGGSKRIYFDISVDRQPLGRIVIELLPGAPAIGGQRFLDLAQGKEGVKFRKTKFELIEDGFIQNSGLKALSYQASERTAITGGPDTELLEDELAAQAAKGGTAHSATGLVSFLVKPRIEIVSKDKLVASKGKFITVTETFGEIPNGSAWAVTTKPVPELDETHLVVARVVQGMDVVEAIAALPRVKDNTSSPFFQAGKLSGDKRADVAQRAFNKPYAKIVVEECGFL